MLKTLLIGTVTAWMMFVAQVAACAETEEFLYLRAVLFSEAHDNFEGQVAVAAIVFNRKDDPAYPDTVKGVVTQTKPKQFSYSLRERPGNAKWDMANINAMIFLDAYCAGQLSRVSELFTVLEGRFEFRSYWRKSSDIEVAGNFFRNPEHY